MSMIPFFGLFFVWIFLGLIVFIPFLIALIDILRNKFEGNNQLMWVLIIFLLPLLGPILYFIIGTKQKNQIDYKTKWLMSNRNIHIHPVENAGALESSFRYRFQNPGKILKNFLKPGMTVLDLGCGPGFFTTEIARKLGGSGKVIAADIQDGMLEKVRQKISGSNLEYVVQIHKCQMESLNLTDKIDFVFAFYSFHEMSCLDNIIDEIKLLLKPEGEIFIAEQKFHVPKSTFIDMIGKMRKRGFEITGRPKVFLSRAVVMKRAEAVH